MAIWMFGYVVSTQITFIVDHEAGQRGAALHVARRRRLRLQLLVRAVPAAVRHHRRLGDHRAAAADEQARGRGQASGWSATTSPTASGCRRSSWFPPRCCSRCSDRRCASSCSPTAARRPRARGTSARRSPRSPSASLPFVIFQLLLRVFYAMHDSRTPAIIGFLTTIATVIGNLVVAGHPAARPAGHRHGLRLRADQRLQRGDRLAAAEQARRRPGRPRGHPQPGAHARGDDPGRDPRARGQSGVGSVLQAGPLYGLIVTLLGGGGALLLYVIVAKALRGGAESADADGGRPVRPRPAGKPGPVMAFGRCPVRVKPMAGLGSSGADVGS